MIFDELLREHSIPTAPAGHHHTRSGWINFDCPWCSRGTRRWRMGYNTQGKYVNCWSCGPHRLVETLVELTNLTPAECFRLLDGIDFEKVRTTRPLGRLELPSALGPLREPHLTYLASRGFDPNTLIRLWNIKGIGLHPRLAWRVFIPILLRGEVVSWTTRATTDETDRRYITARPEQESYPARKLLYGEDYVRHAVVVHEGPFDVWRTGPGAVCTMGTQFSSAQVLRLSKYPTRVVCFDSQPEAQRRARDLCSRLEVFPGETYRVELDAKDAGSASPREINRLRKAFLD